MVCRCCYDMGLLSVPDVGMCQYSGCGRNACGKFHRNHGDNCREKSCGIFVCYEHVHNHSKDEHGKSSIDTFPNMRDYNINFMLNYFENPGDYNVKDVISRASTLAKMFGEDKEISLNLKNIVKDIERVDDISEMAPINTKKYETLEAALTEYKANLGIDSQATRDLISHGRKEMKDARLLKILVEEKALVKLLKTIGPARRYPTRELLTKLGAYGYGHKLLIKAEKKGLIEKRVVKNNVIYSLTAKGKRIVTIAREIGV